MTNSTLMSHWGLELRTGLAVRLPVGLELRTEIAVRLEGQGSAQ
jgi:hypothetical protein